MDTENVLKDTLKSMYEGLDKSIRPLMMPPFKTLNQTDTAYWLENWELLNDGSNETTQGQDRLVGGGASTSKSKSNSRRLF